MDVDVVVVGSVGLDDVETPFGKVERAIGGSANFFALAASYFSKVGYVGVVGEDYPQEAIDLLLVRGVDISGLERQSGDTFRWSGKYGFDLNERDTLFTELNVFESFRPKLSKEYASARYLFLGNIHPALQLDVLDQAKGAEFVALDTMNLWIETTPDELRKVLARVDCALINDSEARELAEEHNIVKAVKKIQAMGPEIVVIKRGEYGALIYMDEDFFYAPAYPLGDVVDPTGAGDSFAGGFMGFVGCSKSVQWNTICQGVVVGSTLASFCVEDFSVNRFRTLTQKDVRKRVRRFRALTDFRPIEVFE